MVKIFITPYMTSISDKDLEFSQGDFNVDVVLALGVGRQEDLDQAITSHGRILHDATVIGISTQADSSLGSINWSDQSASSLCEMLVQLGLLLKADALDNQMSTALLTGIVAETNRFSNEKTSSETMQISAKLMAAGANQQLVASQLQPAAPPPAEPENEELELPQISPPDETEQQVDNEPRAAKGTDGTLRIDHEELKSLGLDAEVDPDSETSEPLESTPETPKSQIHIDDEGRFNSADQLAAQAQSEAPQKPEEFLPPSAVSANSRFILEPPKAASSS